MSDHFLPAPFPPNKGKFKGVVKKILEQSVNSHVRYEVLVQETENVDGVYFNPIESMVDETIQINVFMGLPESSLVDGETIEGFISLKGDENGTLYLFTSS